MVGMQTAANRSKLLQTDFGRVVELQHELLIILYYIPDYGRGIHITKKFAGLDYWNYFGILFLFLSLLVNANCYAIEYTYIDR